MSCSCEDDYCLFYTSEQRTSRKDRNCEECGKLIAKGTPYLKILGRSVEQGFWTFVMCLLCDKDWAEIREIFYQESGELCNCYGELRENISEAIDQGYLDADDPLAQRWFQFEEDIEEDEEVERSLIEVVHYFCTDERQGFLPFEP